MENKRNRLLLWGVCLVASLSVACSGKGGPASSGVKSSSATQTTFTSQQTQGGGDNKVKVGDIGDPTPTQKDKVDTPAKTSADKHNTSTNTKPSQANTTLAPSITGSSTAATTTTSTTSASPATTDQDGFYSGHR